jgi:prepilin-type N-terminal cleavage/methylation domain-containing protein
LLGEGSVRNFRRPRSITGKAGFTILEVMVAISILAVGLMAVFTAQSRSITGNTNANRQTEAMTLAQDKMEELLALFYDDVNTDGSPVSDPGGYTVSWTVDDTVFPNTKLITVTVAAEDIRKPLVLTCAKTRL